MLPLCSCFFFVFLICAGVFGISSTFVQIGVGHGQTVLPQLFMVLLMVVTFGSFTYLSFVWVQRLHKKQQHQQQQQRLPITGTTRGMFAMKICCFVCNQTPSTFGVSSDQINCTEKKQRELANSDGTEKIGLLSFFVINNKFYRDAEYNHKVIQEFKQFAEFMVHEFSSENLLFVINIIQFKQFLIKNNYTDAIFWKQCGFDYDLKDFIHPTNLIEQLIACHEKYIQQFKHNYKNVNVRKEKEVEEQEEVSQIGVDFNVLVSFLKSIFYKFIVANKAPFEVNISYNLRDRATKNLSNIINSDKNDLNSNLGDNYVLSSEMLLNNILPDLIAICGECMCMTEFSWIRYTAKK